MLAAALVLSLAAAAYAQRGFGGFGGRWVPFKIEPNAQYDGRFTFVRVSYLGAHDETINTLTLDDPELFKYPVAYIIEVSWWTLTDREAAALRSYIEKGGFVIVDDFKQPGDFGSPGWEPFEANMKRVLPNLRFYEMQPTHPIFHSFFEIDDLEIVPQAYNYGKPIFRGVYEDNDPNKRLQMIINYNTDVSQFWEWSGTGFRPIDQTNEAYKLGVNYIVYGLTH